MSTRSGASRDDASIRNATTGVGDWVGLMVAVMMLGAGCGEPAVDYRSGEEGGDADVGSSETDAADDELTEEEIRENRREARAWLESKDSAAVPWLHEIEDLETAKDARVEADRVAFPLPEYEEMTEWGAGEIIWANVREVEHSFLRRIVETRVESERVVFDTEEARLSEVFLKLQGGGEDDEAGDMEQQQGGLGPPKEKEEQQGSEGEYRTVRQASIFGNDELHRWSISRSASEGYDVAEIPRDIADHLDCEGGSINLEVCLPEDGRAQGVRLCEDPDNENFLENACEDVGDADPGTEVASMKVRPTLTVEMKEITGAAYVNYFDTELEGDCACLANEVRQIDGALSEADRRDVARRCGLQASYRDKIQQCEPNSTYFKLQIDGGIDFGLENFAVQLGNRADTSQPALGRLKAGFEQIIERVVGESPYVWGIAVPLGVVDVNANVAVDLGGTLSASVRAFAKATWEPSEIEDPGFEASVETGFEYPEGGNRGGGFRGWFRPGTSGNGSGIEVTGEAPELELSGGLSVRPRLSVVPQVVFALGADAEFALDIGAFAKFGAGLEASTTGDSCQTSLSTGLDASLAVDGSLPLVDEDFQDRWPLVNTCNTSFDALKNLCWKKSLSGCAEPPEADAIRFVRLNDEGGTCTTSGDATCFDPDGADVDYVRFARATTGNATPDPEEGDLSFKIPDGSLVEEETQGDYTWDRGNFYSNNCTEQCSPSCFEERGLLSFSDTVAFSFPEDARPRAGDWMYLTRLGRGGGTISEVDAFGEETGRVRCRPSGDIRVELGVKKPNGDYAWPGDPGAEQVQPVIESSAPDSNPELQLGRSMFPDPEQVDGTD